MDPWFRFRVRVAKKSKAPKSPTPLNPKSRSIAAVLKLIFRVWGLGFLLLIDAGP